ncbi:Tex family protein [Spirochaeta africana]|uniref:Transcriptional accessory protein n=1 Tax=Spirochaeta africana (strain ATCC 700263 / DSM 8902 / Z-7692) TaxID=889378 RepID=H9UJX0_SPIAZ|nr:Tex family protein [Spirochaeta africana]AFG37813.1 transcriptional accessory protein [Spirochaeta africana DSM 8902]
MATAKKILDRVARETGIAASQVAATAVLLDEGATVPFIARYRKERTGGLEDVQIIAIRDWIQRLTELEDRRTVVLDSIRDQEKLTPELEAQIMAAESMAVLEDIYLPYRPKRRTRATIARERGLEPLAEQIYAQGSGDPQQWAEAFVNPELEVPDPEAALQGAADIIAERISEDAGVRASLRMLFSEKARLCSVPAKGQDPEKLKKDSKFADWLDWDEQAEQAPSHRILALLRGRSEGVLSIHALPPEDMALERLQQRVVRGNTPAARFVAGAAEDAYGRLLRPSLENELLGQLKLRADEAAVGVFTENLRELLMAAPFGRRPVLALDPGLRTGCKLVCLDAQGALVHNTTIFPLPPRKQIAESSRTLIELCDRYAIAAIAVGNGTGGREAADFVRSLGLQNSDGMPIPVEMVNESGASIYSASQTAREEFPDHDVTVRGAVSIGRRLQDPMSELIKIDPKSIGVGQYQHDVDQKLLKTGLDDVVVGCVNAVGVELNMAGRELLRAVSGISDKLARNIVDYRAEHGALGSRAELKKVSGLGPKAFEQCAGFLRISGAKNPLDASAVHPESYSIVKQMAADLGCSVRDLMQDAGLRKRIELKRYLSDSVGMPTLKDILAELEKPGRDPREGFEEFRFADGVNQISDLREHMLLPGVVTNVTAFGAFVDIGVHQDGLVHISRLADEFVRDPAQVVKVGQKVQVTVLDVDTARKRISLSMRPSDR